jgi:tetrahydromethanopterin S-methyltransferase subunit C
MLNFTARKNALKCTFCGFVKLLFKINGLFLKHGFLAGLSSNNSIKKRIY